MLCTYICMYIASSQISLTVAVAAVVVAIVVVIVKSASILFMVLSNCLPIRLSNGLSLYLSVCLTFCLFLPYLPVSLLGFTLFSTFNYWQRIFFMSHVLAYLPPFSFSHSVIQPFCRRWICFRIAVLVTTLICLFHTVACNAK